MADFMVDPRMLSREDLKIRLELLFSQNPELEVDDLRPFPVRVVELSGREGIKLEYPTLLEDPDHETGRGMFTPNWGSYNPWKTCEPVPSERASFYRDLIAHGEIYFTLESMYALRTRIGKQEQLDDLAVMDNAAHA